MRKQIGAVGYWSGLAAVTATLSYDVVQILQVAGTLSFPFDEILIYGTSLCIVIPFILEMLAFHYLADKEKQFWTHASLLFVVLYAVFVTPNYVVQLATVIPAKLSGDYDSIQVLDQKPHSLFWNFDAIGYIAMGLAVLVALPALSRVGFERWVRFAFLAHAFITPMIATVYFYPIYSNKLPLLGLPWAITAPLSMLFLALLLRKRQAL
jgi:heme/copper-type cytochrome/quinol oxidase subunit 4